jgi:hypothetical protein
MSGLVTLMLNIFLLLTMGYSIFLGLYEAWVRLSSWLGFFSSSNVANVAALTSRNTIPFPASACLVASHLAPLSVLTQHSQASLAVNCTNLATSYASAVAPMPDLAWALTITLPLILFWFIKAGFEDTLLRRGFRKSGIEADRWSSPHFRRQSRKLSKRVATVAARSGRSEDWAKHLASEQAVPETSSATSSRDSGRGGIS